MARQILEYPHYGNSPKRYAEKPPEPAGGKYSTTVNGGASTTCYVMVATMPTLRGVL